ncbi:hypothetical protein HYPSUDRAFT_61695 [Hypholoma sublateritium FD-334 SS-4]|uniref:GST N-terminal domain-containing protein n=1 Tax=Hypholoma sublateritium (strain FD-334 SS-4) TaxID=945553 RepID=A0A0D2PKC9_HYPSF|nr:hypothetical protein HYPSUDRAFT_61695 [Hypholoma sublateritium FD-334 SS-4]
MPLPDEQIYPHATGAAEALVAKHQEPQPLVFYAGWFCPYVQRAWIALEEKGIPYQYKEVNPYKKEAHFLAINPKGLVPALEYGGHALYESLIICEFFEDAFPAHTPHLLPTDPVQRARARMAIDQISKTLVPTFQRLLPAADPEAQRTAREAAYSALRAFAAGIKGPWYLGEEFSLVDVAIAPWIVRDYIITENRGYKRAEVGAAWEAYAGRLEKRESVVNTSSLREHMAPIYGRYLRDEAQSEAARAIREGRAIP